MADSGVVIPAKIGKIVNERATLWKKLDESQSQYSQLEKLGAQVASSTPSPVPSVLTDEATPPAELSAAVQKLQEELASIAKAQEEIHSAEIEIKRLANRQLTVVIVVTVIIVALLGLAVATMMPLVLLVLRGLGS